MDDTQVGHHLKSVSEYQSIIHDKLAFDKAVIFWGRAGGNTNMGGKLLEAVLFNRKIYDLSQELRRDFRALTSRLGNSVLKSGSC